MLTPGNLETLSTFNPSPLLVTSLYLNTDPKRFPKPALQATLKDLSRERLAELRTAGLTRDQLKSVESDLERLHDFVAGKTFAKPGEHGLAAFSCAGRDLFQHWSLPHGFKATLLTGPTAYLRPLSALLAQSANAIAVVVDQKVARAWRLQGEEALPSFEVVHETGSKIKKGGLKGLDERHLEHHHDEVVHHHYQDVADRLLKAFQASPFEYLVLGGHLDELRDFERHLHSYLADRVAGRFRTEVKTAVREDVRLKAAELVRTEERNRQQDAVQRLIGASRTNGGLAVTGLKNTLAALNDRRIQALLVAEDLVVQGKRCASCETLFEKEPTCPRCSAPTQDSTDIVDEALALAVHQGGAIRILPADSPLAGHGKVGAMLRY